jgi:glycosyltransferase involved in cell wall biosynthesis
VTTGEANSLEANAAHANAAHTNAAHARSGGEGVALAGRRAYDVPGGDGEPAPRQRAPRSLKMSWILPRTGLSGGVKSTRLLAEAMVARGHDVTIAYLEAGDSPWPSPLHVGRFARRAIRALREPSAPAPVPHHLQSSTAKLIPVAGDEVPHTHVPDADFVIGTWWETLEWMRSWPARKGIQAHFIRHYETFGGDPERVKAVYRDRTMKFVIARWLQRLMVQEYGHPQAVLVPNGVDWHQFHAEPRGKSAAPTVGLQYSQVKWKDTGTAFEALRIAQKTLPGLRVIAFGNKPLQPSDNPPKNLEFFLRPPQDEIPRLYARCDCWVLSSITEGFGMPGLESAACRCPVVSTRCGGPEDYVQDGVTGYLVDVGNAQQMARRIIDVVTRGDADWRRMSEASYAVARTFNWERSAEILEDALLAALPAGASAASAAST